jgi:hypothetical protein
MKLRIHSLTFLTIPLLFGFQLTANYYLSTLDSATPDQLTTEARELDPEILQLLSFGNLPTGIDYLTLLTLSDPSLGKVPRGIHPNIYYYLKAIVRMDPLFSELSLLANMLVVIRGDAIGARDLLEQSQDFVRAELPYYSESFKNEFWPNPWQGQIFLAYVNLFELDDLPRAATSFKAAAAMPGSPSYLKHLEHRLNQPGGEHEIGLNLLQFLHKGAKNPVYRDNLEKKFKNLSISYYFFRINFDFQAFLKNQDPVNRSTLLQKFLLSIRSTKNDPWGAELYLNEGHKIVSNTQYEKVFGIK